MNRKYQTTATLAVAIIGILGLSSLAEAANDLRCHDSLRASSGRLVVVGDSRSHVIKALGTPDDSRRIERRPFYHHGPCWKGADHDRLHHRRPEVITEWTYLEGSASGGFVHVTFRNGSVSRVCRFR